MFSMATTSISDHILNPSPICSHRACIDKLLNFHHQLVTEVGSRLRLCSPVPRRHITLLTPSYSSFCDFPVTSFSRLYIVTKITNFENKLQFKSGHPFYNHPGVASFLNVLYTMFVEKNEYLTSGCSQNLISIVSSI